MLAHLNRTEPSIMLVGKQTSALFNITKGQSCWNRETPSVVFHVGQCCVYLAVWVSFWCLIPYLRTGVIWMQRFHFAVFMFVFLSLAVVSEVILRTCNKCLSHKQTGLKHVVQVCVLNSRQELEKQKKRVRKYQLNILEEVLWPLWFPFLQRFITPAALWVSNCFNKTTTATSSLIKPLSLKPPDLLRGSFSHQRC